MSHPQNVGFNGAEAPFDREGSAPRIPRPFVEMVARLGLPDAAESPQECLGRMGPRRILIHDYRPMARGLEWELATLYWRRTGLMAFAEERVPYAVTNDGYLSDCAAALLFAHCEEVSAGGPIRVLELGAGSGLFARFFLDAFRDLCRHERRDYYDRLDYVVTDVSPRTVEQWAERGVFAGHLGRATMRVCDAMAGTILGGDGPVASTAWRAVFANYMLDSLPAAVLRRGPCGVEELCSRTWLAEAPRDVARIGSLDMDQLRELAESESEENRAQLIPLLPRLEFEAGFVRLDHPPPYAEEALSGAAEGEAVAVNQGAFRCLELWSGRLEPGGFILLNDYGGVQEEAPAPAGPDRFGPTVAMGLNFGLMERILAARGWATTRPAGDEALPIHPRLVSQSALPETLETFHELFGGERYRQIEVHLEEARRLASDGQVDLALECYRVAVDARPRDWRLLGEAAEFINYRLKEPATALELAIAALRLNPWYSAWLWNVLGDALFELGRTGDAQEAFLQSLCIDPANTRAYYGLVFTRGASGDLAEALGALASALAADGAGVYRDRLLEKQQHLLALIRGEWEREQAWLARRAVAWGAERRPPRDQGIVLKGD